MHDREKLYRYLWDHTGANGAVSIPQGEVARDYGISYQHLSVIMKEFVDLGMIEKNKHQFVCLYDPNKIPWAKFKDLRKRYVESQS
jgi:hypothetical protein